MSKITQLKKMFGHTEKEKVQVRIGPKVEELTVTQSYRFDELSKSWKVESTPVENPFEKSRYTLAEASFRMQKNETEILEKTVVGALVAYVNAGGLKGHWRGEASAGDALRTAPQVLVSGYLALTTESCRELLEGRGTTVSILEFLSPSRTAVDFDARQAADLGVWGDGRKLFCLTEPLYVEREHIVFMAPLAGKT